MKQVLERQLADNFPFMKARNYRTGRKLKSGIACECQNGWFDLIFNLCRDIQNLYDYKGIKSNKLRIYQVKEKWGRLCFYIGNYIQGTNEIVNKYEKLSESTCETCGDEAELMIRGSWYRTLCLKHGEEQ